MKMKPVSWRIIVGLIILVIGGLALLQSLNVLPIGQTVWDIILPACFVAAGLVFIYVLITNKANWWAAIPGFTLVGLGALIGLNEIPGIEDAGWTAAVFMGFIGLGFLVVYLLDRSHWWAIIPAGSMISVGLLIAFGGVFYLFFGLAATFAAVALFSKPATNRIWPWIPAAVLGVMGITFLFAEKETVGYVFPALIVAGGLFLIIYSLVKKH
jgi:hypothetical protein